MIVHHPHQNETASNLALLDIAAGHFSRLEYRSGGTLPGSLISEFSHIARHYVNEAKSYDASQLRQQPPVTVPALHSPALSRVAAQDVPQSDNPVPNEDFASQFLTPLGQEDRQEQQTYLSGSATLQTPQSGLVNGWIDDCMTTDALMGTDVMGIFNNFLPGLDPMFYQGMAGDWDFGQGLARGGAPEGQ